MPLGAQGIGRALRPDASAAEVLGFSNRWYPYAVETAESVELSPGVTIRLISAVAFVPTKLEAFAGRGGGDFLSSHDIEDVLNIVDGREELTGEMAAARPSCSRPWLWHSRGCSRTWTLERAAGPDCRAGTRRPGRATPENHVLMNPHKEHQFEREICAHLTAHGWAAARLPGQGRRIAPSY